MESAETPPCKHEYVRIFQRKLKGLERRLVSTKAYLPVGFKMADFGHLSEGSFCFCTKCRARLFPKRTAAEKAQARLANQAKMAAAAEAREADYDSDSSVEDFVDSLLAEDAEEEDDKKNSAASISVEELEIVPTELEELAESGSDLSEEDESDDG